MESAEIVPVARMRGCSEKRQGRMKKKWILNCLRVQVTVNQWDDILQAKASTFRCAVLDIILLILRSILANHIEYYRYFDASDCPKSLRGSELLLRLAFDDRIRGTFFSYKFCNDEKNAFINSLLSDGRVNYGKRVTKMDININA